MRDVKDEGREAGRYYAECSLDGNWKK